MSSTAIRVRNLGKEYQLGPRDLGKTSFREALLRAASAPFERFRRLSGRGPADESFWALKGVSFDVREGEVVGVIGRNGAGKSTLLKILSQITEPTTGEVELHGRVGSLLEVGTGFHPELSGRENIYLNGAILGMKRAEIIRRFDDIVAFAEVEKFLDTPVKRYSSGMYVRLAFAVAAHLEPDILLIDEVLAVGDSVFQKKCLGRMGEVAKQGRTVIFVSHNMGVVNQVCEHAIWLDQGQIFMAGETEAVISKYLTLNTSEEGERCWDDGWANPGVTELKLFRVRVCNDSGAITSSIDVRKPFSIELDYRIDADLPYCRVGFLLQTSDGVTVLEAYDSDFDGWEPRKKGHFHAKCTIPGNLLNPGAFVISINIGMPNLKNLVYLEGLLMVNIEETHGTLGLVYARSRGIIRPKLDWQKVVLN